MAEDTSVTNTEGAGQTQVRLQVNEKDMRITYSNGYRIHPAPEEVVLDIGFNMPDPNVQQSQAAPQLLFNVTDRVIMSYGSAKRLAMSLTQLVKRFEQQYGEIPVQPGARRS